LPWSAKDFAVFFLGTLVGTKFCYWFWIRYFSRVLLSGDLNSLRTKPINPFVSVSMLRKDSAIYSTWVVFAIVLWVMFSFDFQNQFLALVLLFFSVLYYVVFMDFFQSTAFFIKENAFLIYTTNQVTFLNEQFTPKVFEKSPLWFLFIIPTALSGYFFVEVLNSRFEELLFYLPYILGTFVVFALGTYLLWHYGLNKYEAYG
jgi:hypothetical protein